MGNGVRIYDVRQPSGSVEPILALKSRSSVNSLSWSPNGHFLATGCQSGMTYLWDVRHPAKEMTTFKTQEKNPVQVYSCVSIHPIVFISSFLLVPNKFRSLVGVRGGQASFYLAPVFPAPAFAFKVSSKVFHPNNDPGR